MQLQAGNLMLPTKHTCCATATPGCEEYLTLFCCLSLIKFPYLADFQTGFHPNQSNETVLFKITNNILMQSKESEFCFTYLQPLTLMIMPFLLTDYRTGLAYLVLLLYV